MDNRSARLPRICFVAHNAYGALTGIDNGHIGGIEQQQALMARWLTGRGYDVSMVTWGEAQMDEARQGGVRALPMCRRDAGVRFLRFFHPRWSSLTRALAQADADLYYYNCGDLELGQVVRWARRHGRTVLYSVANEMACHRSLPHLSLARERAFYRYGVRRADAIIVQTNNQQRLLAENFHRVSTVIPMPSAGFTVGSNGANGSAPPPRVLWAGRLDPVKRLEWLLEIARRCPQIAFDVVGSANTDSGYARKLVEEAKSLSNVRLHGRVVHRDMASFYGHATVLCNTSTHEGFPNTFLEAWSAGVPVVTSFDPDGVVEANGLGRVGRTTDQLERAILELCTSAADRRRASDAARAYFLKRHSLDGAMPRFELFFQQLLRSKP